MVLYNYDSNAILAEPCKQRTGEALAETYKILHQRLVKSGVVPILQRLDNEASKIMIRAIEERKLEYQLASPHDHRLNPAERAIQTWKNHFISNLHGCDSAFPAYKWCEIMKQCEMTLNMLRPSRINPKMSAYTQLNGLYDYNRTPLAPLGTKAFVHERPNQRRTFADHGKIGFVIGPATQHYRHLTFYIPSTRGTRITDTYVFIPSKFELPANAAADRSTVALEEFTNALNSKRSRDIPFTDKGINNAIRALRNVLSTTGRVTQNDRPDVTRPRVVTRANRTPTVVNNNGRTVAQPPRVQQRNNNNNNRYVQPPRVHNNPTRTMSLRQRPQVIAQVHTVGTRVYKVFEQQNGRLKWHRGYICEYDDKEGYYKVKYEDNDIAEYNAEEISGMLHKPNNDNLIQAMAATRHARIEAQYAKTTTTYAPPSPYTGGWSKAMLMIEANTFDICQGYKYANGVVDDETGKIMDLKSLLKHPKYIDTWTKAAADEYGRLFQGIGKSDDGSKQRIEGTNTCHWIKKEQVPNNKRATYVRTVVDVRPEKDNPNRVRMTAGGNILDYYGETSTETASIETAKILINSVLSTKNAKFMSIDISNFYIQTDLEHYQYIRFPIDMIPKEVVDEYDLTTIVAENGYCYAEIRKAMYGLKESGYLANIELKRILALQGYEASKFTPGLFTHKTRDIAFSLVVDDFGVKYTKKEDAEHLFNTIQNRYPVKASWNPDYYLGVTLEFDYVKRTCKFSMPGYVRQNLLKFHHEFSKTTNSPSPFLAPAYGRKTQMATVDATTSMTAEQTTLLQQVCGTFLYYARAVDCTMLHALNDLATRVHDGTQKTMEALNHFLDYCATNPDTVLIYRASDMILHNHSDAAYLVATGARSRAAGYTYFGNNSNKQQIINGPISIIAKIIKMVVSSAAEAEIAALYMNARELLPLRVTCAELGHPQPPTPMRTDNNTASGIINGTLKQARSKAIDMRFYWLLDRSAQKQFKIYWERGIKNLADYFSKHHSAKHHKQLRPIYSYMGKKSPSSLQGCIELLAQRAPKYKAMVRLAGHGAPAA